VPVSGDDSGEERVVVRRLRKVKAHPARGHDVMQERLGERGEQIFLVGEVAVEHRGRFARRRRDVGQRRPVKPTLGEQLPGGLFDGFPGLATLRAERPRGWSWHGYWPRLRSPARSRELGSSWPTTRCATSAAAIAACRSTSTWIPLSRNR